MTNDKKTVMVSLTEKEKKLIELLRTFPHGQVTIFKQDGEPVRVELIKESVKL